MSNHYLKIEHLRNYDNLFRSIKVEFIMNSANHKINSMLLLQVMFIIIALVKKSSFPLFLLLLKLLYE